MPALALARSPDWSTVTPLTEVATGDEQALVARARHDPEAFAALYRAYVQRIYAFTYRRSRSKEVSEDVTAATFERALRSLDTFEWRGSGFAGWLHRIAAHELADHYRRQGRAQTARGQRALRELAGGGVVGADDAVPDERVDVVLAALGRINPRYQQAVSLRYLAGLSHEEAAEAMGCSKPVMAVTLHRALAALRREMGVAGADDADARDRGDERDRVDEGDR